MNELITKQNVEDWNSGKINEISSWHENCETYHSLVYYPKEDVTISLFHFFEGYYNDEWVKKFEGVSKGRRSIERIVKCWNNEYLEMLEEYDD